MMMAIHGIDSGHIAQGDTVHNDCHRDPKATYSLANRPVEGCDGGGDRLRDDRRWPYGVPAWGKPILASAQPVACKGSGADTRRTQSPNRI